jgi:hypothetical protein
VLRTQKSSLSAKISVADLVQRNGFGGDIVLRDEACDAGGEMPDAVVKTATDSPVDDQGKEAFDLL